MLVHLDSHLQQPTSPLKAMIHRFQVRLHLCQSEFPHLRDIFSSKDPQGLKSKFNPRAAHLSWVWHSEALRRQQTAASRVKASLEKVTNQVKLGQNLSSQPARLYFSQNCILWEAIVHSYPVKTLLGPGVKSMVSPQETQERGRDQYVGTMLLSDPKY